MDMRRRAAFVTGGRRGIGRAIAVALSEDGFDVVVNDIVEDEAVAETLDAIRATGRRATFVCGDIADLQAQDALVDAAWAAFGGIDCHVNNAGVQTSFRGDMLDVPPESFDRLVNINMRGTYFLSQRIARRMLAEPGHSSTRPERSMFFLSSGNAVIATATQAEYCITKAGIAMMATLYAMRLAEAGIAVHEIRPGMIRTDMTADVFDKYDSVVQSGRLPIPRWGEPEDIGRTVAALASGALPYVTGHAFHVDGGFHIRRS
jgi:3-oxoacyl-[acyl-carrier protein] reductase